MADRLMMTTQFYVPRARWLAVCLTAACWSFSSGAHALDAAAVTSTGADPTRPPAALLAPVEDTSSLTNEVPASGLQTIILRKGAKPMAVINGERVELGGRVGDARLVHVGETEVVLQGANGKETLKMTPGVEIKPVVAPRLAKPARSAKSKISKKKKAKLSMAKPKSTETE